VLYIFENYSDVLDKWQDKCMYMLCDEYQDVNKHQELLLKQLCGKYENLTVVGDDDQCIYGWRGSRVEYIVDFHRHYHPIKDHYLTENFRSTPEIIAVANSLIKANQNRIPKIMVTNNPSGPKPVYNNAPTEKEEAFWIAQTINDAVSQGKQYSDHAVLVRASSQTRAVEEAFVVAKIPYKILSGAKFYDSEAIRTTLAYLRMVYAMNDLDFTETINSPKRGYGKKSVEKLRTYAEQMNLTLMEALGAQISTGIEKRQAVIDYYNGIIKLNNTHQNYSCVDIANMALDIGYRAAIQSDIDQTKVDNVSELLDTIAALEAENQEIIPLSDLLAHFALFEKADDDTDKDVVKIMTVHTAKGLEFDTVFVNGLVQGQFPSKQLRNQDELEEERRLFYVAITRAKSMLYLSSYDEKVQNYPAEQSCFLKDIDESLLNCINNSKIQGPYSTPAILSKAQFVVGDMVLHDVFGQGIVIGVDEKSQTYEIQFDNIAKSRRILFRATMTKL
ncbi:MAG: UvrD-helicase domain-containing protein, partial [Muribaculaceae bacterium]|nr:UvrD-helicase domain-containing protein [Muribaculaceae bacterium]